MTIYILQSLSQLKPLSLQFYKKNYFFYTIALAYSLNFIS